MKSRFLKMAVPAIAAAFLAVGALATDYVWIGQGVDPDFDTSANWAVFGEEEGAYPNSTSATAQFPWSALAAWDCNLIGEEIGDMTIKGSVDFDTAGGTVTLNVTKLIISPTGGDIEITMNGTAEIEVD